MYDFIGIGGEGEMNGVRVEITAAGYGTNLGIPYTPSYKVGSPSEHNKGTVVVTLGSNGKMIGYQYTDSWDEIYNIN